MDVTKYDFEAIFDDLKGIIHEADFIAIDGEFTGLSKEPGQSWNRFESPADRYKKLRQGASDFLIVQFGLCVFKANKAEKRYEARPYNFYIFPRPFDQHSPDRRFLCQSSSIDFLISHDFDFNKVFKEGIPYLTSDQEAKMRFDLEAKLADKMNNLTHNTSSSTDKGSAKKKFVVPDDHKKFIADVQAKMDEYLKSDNTEPMSLAPCNSFQRRLIYHSLGESHPSLHIETNTGEKKERYITVSKCGDKKDMEMRELSKHNVEMMKLDIHFGFSKVMRLITESGKLVVGHNMYLDVIHSVNHFHSPIPEDLEDFKDMISCIFPRLLDTKLMANTSPFREYFLGTSLEELKHTLRLPPFKAVQIDFPEGFTKYTDNTSLFHEAGYDAFVTGSCFASLINFLGHYQHPSTNFLLPTHHAVQPFVNKLYMMYIADIPYVNLAGPDVEPPRDHVFHVTFPAEWRATDLYQLFEPHGNIQISWLNSNSAYVALNDKDKTDSVLTSLCCQSSAPYQVISYAVHRHMLKTVPNPSAHVVESKPTESALKRKSTTLEEESSSDKIPRTSLTGDTIIEEEEKKKLEEEEIDIGVPVTMENEKMVIEIGGAVTEENNAMPIADDVEAGDKLFAEPDSWG